LRELRADRAAADDRERAGQRLGGDGVAVGPVGHVGQARDRRRGRRRAGGQDDATAGAEHPLADGDLARRSDAGPAADEHPTLADEPVHRHLVVPGVGRLGPDPGGDRRPVRRHGGHPGQAVDPAGLGKRARGADHHLRRHAPPIRALAADQLGLHTHHGKARLGQPPGDLLAADP
jgi:hypothetical protein